MKLYYLDEKNLVYRRIFLSSFYISFIVLKVIIIFLLYFSNKKEESKIEYEKQLIVLEKQEEFSPKKLFSYILDLKIKFPKVVMCQAILETGFNSNIFKNNNNIFNMRISTTRPTTQIGINNGYAVYSNWKESVIDYAIWQAYVISPNIKTDYEYFDFLEKAKFAESQNYIENLKKIYMNFDKILNLYESKINKNKK